MAILTQSVSSHLVRELAAKVGFRLAGVWNPGATPDFERFRDWAGRGLAGEMRYLTDHRADVRADLNLLLPGVKSVISVGMLYQPSNGDGIAGYARGEDYHVVMRRGLEDLAARLCESARFEWRACVDTAPLLERSVAREAGLGWIGRNTCLISQEQGSYFLLGELLTTLAIETDAALDAAPPDRCGTCRRCIEACPTQAIVPSPGGGFELDARVCISYFTIELRGAVPEEYREAMGGNVFGCDICQDVCPWNRKAPISTDPELAPRAELVNPSLEWLADLEEADFEKLFNGSPVRRAGFRGLRRNIAIAMGNSGLERFLPRLNHWASEEQHQDATPLSEAARWAFNRIRNT